MRTRVQRARARVRWGAIFLVLSALTASYGGQTAEVIQKGQTLNLEQCIAITLERLPAILAVRATSEADKSLIRQAEANYYPQIDWSSAFNRTSVGPRSSYGFKTSSVTYNYYSTGLNLSQDIFDFGKTPTQVRIQRLTYNSSVSDIETAIQQAVFNVKQDYYGVLQAKRNTDVVEDAVKQYQLHLDQANGQYEVGLAPKYDVTKAQVDLGNAKVNLIKARNAVKLALATLNNAMGVTGTLEYDVQDNMAFEAYGVSFEDALAEAYKNRPDLTSLVAKRQAAESSITLAKKGFFPVLSGSASYDYAGNAFPLGRGWSLGVSLDVPVFNGFLTTAQVAQARANLNVIRANEESLRQSVYLAVEQAYINLKEAEELVPVDELNVTAAQENFDIANGSYKEGVGDPIQVADASAALITAKIAYIDALYQCKVTRATLEQAMGLR
ncbi:MAG: TolC family protein [Candidatus Aminicenantales bacterium]